MDEEPQNNDQSTGQNGASAKAKTQKENNGSSVSNTPRKRVSQACDRCRSRKDKCDGKKPVCSTCAGLNQVCSYDPATKKRGLPEGYVRGLEKLWGLTIREAAGVEDTVLSLLGSDGADLGDLEILSRVWNDREGTETLLETWRKSRISRELERLLPVLDSIEEKPGKRKRPETGAASQEGILDASPLLARNIAVESKTSLIDGPYWNEDDVSILPLREPHRRRLMQTSSLPIGKAREIRAELSELPSRAWNLLDVFFSYTHCWLPIIEKHDLLRTSYQYSQRCSDISTSSPGSGDHAALWAVLAYTDYQHNAIADRDPAEDSKWTVDSLYRHAKTLIPDEEGVFELGHVQALLVLSLLNMGRNSWERAWLLVGQAVRISINLGLDKRPSDQKSRSQHVFLGCFLLDTITAARLARTPQLRKEDVDRVGQIEEDGLDEWNPWMDCLSVRRSTPDGPGGPTAVLSTFNRLVLLFKIINSVICDTSAGVGTVRTDNCTHLLNELDSWGQVLPALLDPTSKPPLLPHRFHLHLAHISTIAIVYSHLSACNKEMQISDITIIETFATTARQAMWLLMRQSESFGLLIAPPTYDYFSKTACESAQKVQEGISDEHLTYKDWARNMDRAIASMGKTWPTFETLRESLPSYSSDIYQYQSPPSSTTLPYSGSFELSQHIPSHTKHPSINDSVYSFNGARTTASLTPREFSAPSSATFPSQQYNPLLSFPPSAGLLPVGVGEASPSWQEHNTVSNPFVDQPSADQLQFRDGSLGSDVDGDSMFNDFATLDAMEWTNNWDQSLLNLGFTDAENMNQDFYAFCREPDPLYSNNNSTLVQQLLSSSTTSHGADARGALFGDTGSGTGGGLSGLSGLEGLNPHVEASQILQALSSGAGGGGGGGGRVL